MKPLAPHGTYARFVGRPASNIPGCRCQPCTQTGSTYRARRNLLNATGRTLTVAPGRATAHLQYLLGHGASWNTISAAGCSQKTIRMLLAGEYTFIRRNTEQLILAIQLADVIAPKHRVPAIGARRRLQALIAIGYPVQRIADETGMHVTQIRPVLNGHQDTVVVTTHQKIAATYRRLFMVPGPSSRAKGRAARERWPSPLAWDDNIDDPAARPVLDAAPSPDDDPDIDEIAIARLVRGDRTVRLNQNERPVAARQMAKLGISPFAAATALHTNVRSVRAWLAEAA
jgi:hypothetical protein